MLVAGSFERHDGLAVVAVIARTDSSEADFHHVGGPQGDPGTREHLERFRATLAGLTAPGLADDAGTAYEPVSAASATWRLA